MAEQTRKGVLKCEEGYQFHHTGTHTIALMRGNQATGSSFTCDCSSTGGCKVTLTEGSTTAECTEDGCKGSCTWTIHVPGIHGVFIARQI